MLMLVGVFFGTLALLAPLAQAQEASHILTVNCGTGGTCSHQTGSYPAVNPFTFSATADTGYVVDTFTIYGEASSTFSGSPSLTVPFDFDRDATISVTFKVKDQATTYNIVTASMPDYGSRGSIRANNATGMFYSATAGSQINITVEPVDGYRLTSLVWYQLHTPEDRNDILADQTFTMPDAAVWVEATFEPVGYTLTVTCGTGNDGSCSHSTGEHPNLYDKITFDALPSRGFLIDTITLTGHGETSSFSGASFFTAPIEMDRDMEITVAFKPQLGPETDYALSIYDPITIDGFDGGRASFEGGLYTRTAKEGETIKVVTSPKVGFRLKKLEYFRNDLPDSERIDITSTKSFAMPAGTVWVQATFEVDPN